MTHEDRTAYTAKPASVEPLAPVAGLGKGGVALHWAVRHEWGLLLVTSGCCHVIFMCLVLLALPGGGGADPAHGPGALRASLPMRTATMMEERLDETQEDTLEAHEMEIVAEEPVLRDEAFGEPVEGDNDLPYEESLGIGTGGSSEGLSDAPYEGPANNGSIGIGGGAGGSFSGRGGGRDLGTAGGGRRRATTQTWQRSTLSPHTLRLRVGDDETLPLRGIHASVRVDGFRARVVLDCYFENDRGRVLEGDFQVRLPGGATPHSLAFGEMRLEASLRAAAGKDALSTDIDALMRQREETWNQPREARMVPRTRAARAFKEMVRRRDNPDPALLEWTGAGVFHARVFPLQPRRLQRVVLGYDVDLVQAGDELLYRLDLPADVPELLVDLEVRQAGARVSPRARSHEGRYRWWNPAERTFEVRVPRRRAQLLQGEDPATGGYFALRVQPRMPLDTEGGSARAVFALDTSYSSGPDAYPVHLKLMEAILTTNRGTLLEFALLTFDVQTSWWREDFVDNTEANVAAALAHAREQTLEGATDVARALAAATAPDGDYDIFLLSDGAPTWGEREPAQVARRLAAGHTLFAYTTGLGTSDDRMLQRFAAQTGGGVFAVTSEEDLAAAGSAHTRRPWRLEGVHVDGAADVLVGGDPSWVYPGQTLRIVGRGSPGALGYTRISMRRGDTQLLLRFTAEEVIDSPLAPRTYGQVAAAHLEGAAHVQQSLRAAYASHFRVVGKACSLLMLESEADYDRFGLAARNHAGTITEHHAGVAARAGGEAGAGEPENAREELVRWLDGLDAGGEPPAELAEDLRAALGGVPPECFATVGVPLTCRALTRASVPADFLERLDKHTLTYDGIEAEAERRSASRTQADALRVLSTLVEDRGDDPNILRDVAERAAALGFGGHAHHLWRRVVDRRPGEPQGFAMMGRGLAAAGRAELAIVCYEAALARSAPARYGAFRRSTLFEYVHLLDAIERGSVTCALRPWASERLGALGMEIGVHEADLVVTLGWNTDRTDVDLHIFDPAGEHCHYAHKTTKMGGRLTRDVTEGYGPELFVLPKADPGTYRLAADYFRGDSRRVSGRVAVNVVIYRGWGRPDGTVERRTVVLRKAKERADVGLVTLGK